MNDPLVRYAPWPAEFEVRSNPDTGGLRWSGYAAVFGEPSLPLRFPGVNRGRPFVEVIQPGAFTRTLNAGPDISLLWQHDLQGVILGRTSAGTLSLSEDSRGLRAEGDLPDNAWGRPIADALTRGDVRGMSYRMGIVKDNAQADGTYPSEALPDGSLTAVRRMREIKLEAEVSFTNRPATPATSAGMRSLPDAVSEAIAVLEDDGGRLTRAQLALLTDYLRTRASSAACCAACDAEDGACCGGSSTQCPTGCVGGESCSLGCKCIGAAEMAADAAEPKSASDAEKAGSQNTVRKDALRARLAALRTGE